MAWREAAHRSNFAWLLTVRWCAIIGQIVTVLGAWFLLDMRFSVVLVGTFVSLEVLSNITASVFLLKGGVPGEHTIAWLMVLDLLCLTGLLYATGGPANPFNFLYLVHIALATVVLRARWTWLLSTLSVGLFGLLFFFHEPIWFSGLGGGNLMTIHLQGMWVAFAVAAVFITYFVHRISQSLEASEKKLREAQDFAAKTQRLASLATLAAGAAHELSTPLSTIAVVSGELERSILGHHTDDAIEDARLIRGEVERCRAVLQQLTADAGHSAGELPVPISARELVQEALSAVPRKQRVHISFAPKAADARVSVGRSSMVQALRGIIKNATESTEGGADVEVKATLSGKNIRFVVEDQGDGMSPQVLDRVFEPFFTTKPQGRGMGLGLFLARSVVERHAGKLSVRSVPGAGTTMTLEIPLEEA